MVTRGLLTDPLLATATANAWLQERLSTHTFVHGDPRAHPASAIQAHTDTHSYPTNMRVWSTSLNAHSPVAPDPLLYSSLYFALEKISEHMALRTWGSNVCTSSSTTPARPRCFAVISRPITFVALTTFAVNFFAVRLGGCSASGDRLQRLRQEHQNSQRGTSRKEGRSCLKQAIFTCEMQQEVVRVLCEKQVYSCV